jgi:hypothetical protein
MRVLRFANAIITSNKSKGWIKMYEKLVLPLPQEFNEIVPEGGDPGILSTLRRISEELRKYLAHSSMWVFKFS